MSDTVSLPQANKTGITRRNLLKWTGIAAAAAATMGTSGCAGFDNAAEETDAQQEDQGEWIPCNCWADCGSRGFNKALVKNGEVVRMGTDQTHEDTPDCPQMRACARGRSMRGLIFGADRLKYPMKRKNWQPGGGENAHGELRGIDEWERISWDEALDLAAQEIQRVLDTYGNEGVLMPGGVPAGRGDWDVGRLMYLLGGCIEQYGAVSSGAWSAMAKNIGLPEENNDRMDLRTSQLIVMWAYNPAWSRTGLPTYDLHQCKAAGTKFISVDVNYNATARTLTDDFIAIRPGTDTAMLLGMSYVLLTQDDPETNPLIDWDFLDRCTIGFDADHMPEGVDPSGNFKDYVLGTYDGQPKDPAWASEICGAAPADIERLALEIARTERKAVIMSPAPARTSSGVQLCQAVLSFGAMAGCIGKPGCCMASDAGHAWMQGGYLTLYKGGGDLGNPNKDTPGAIEYVYNPLADKKCNVNQMWTSILNEEPYTASDGTKYENKVHLIFDRHENFLNQGPGTMLGIEAYRKMDTVIALNFNMATTCLYADIVFPVSSMWERFGAFDHAYRETMVWTSKVVEPLFESRSDRDVAAGLADRLGVPQEELFPVSEEQFIVDTVLGATVLDKNNKDWNNLVSATKEDLEALGVEGEPQDGLINILDFKRQGIYTIERTADDGRNYVPLQAFREDPEGNPLSTASGKLEIYSQAAADQGDLLGFRHIDPIAKYVPMPEGYEATFSDWDNKVKGEYPFQLLNWHILRHSHSTFGDVPNLREAFDHPLYMNPVDAEALGMETGETVLISSQWGKCLRPLLVIDTIMPGVLAMGQGAWVEIDEETGIDKAGCANVLCGPNVTGTGYQSWNSCIVKVEKWDGEPLAPDAEWEPRQVFKED